MTKPAKDKKKAEAADSTLSCSAKTPVLHDGVEYAIGETVELDADAYERLAALGAVSEPIAQAVTEPPKEPPAP